MNLGDILNFFFLAPRLNKGKSGFNPGETPVKQRQQRFHGAGNCRKGFTGQADYTDFTDFTDFGLRENAILYDLIYYRPSPK